ncbi:glycosyltransferase family 2 protein [Phaeodactylibacter luteus]|uniref:Glycosyltransferase family 2 protein n=1 Tax=Phaeodactylibacter luteus TaxID=1564516 RepID=A0A5C6RK83_9BACT|nr:glycosyltransferase family 2 protein [Phaeodactylibacter luteus]TXB62384.1 glycosyltransferase family 2 protein [Phaeodactylibacter luteus]
MLVSIIIPAYNVEAYVGEALDSALAQTYRPIEIIAVDNNSTDGTLGVLQQYQMLHPKLITVLQEPKQGAPAARNLGLKHAKGEWLQFLDADDILLPEKIERQVGLVSFFFENENRLLAIVTGAYLFEKINGQRVKYNSSERIWRGLISGSAGITSANLFKKESVSLAGQWDESLCSSQEYNLMYRILTMGYLGCSYNACLTIVRQRANSISTSTLFNTKLEASYFRLSVCKDLKNLDKGKWPDGVDVSFLNQMIVKQISVVGLFNHSESLALYRSFFGKTKVSLTLPVFSRSFIIGYQWFGFKFGVLMYSLFYQLRRLLKLELA